MTTYRRAKDLDKLNKAIDKLDISDASEMRRLQILTLQRDLLLITRPMRLLLHNNHYEYYPSMTPVDFIRNNDIEGGTNIGEIMSDLYKEHFTENYGEMVLNVEEPDIEMELENNLLS